MENMTLYNAVRKVPQNAQKPITGGRLKGFTDINPMWRIEALTTHFGPCGLGWYYEVRNRWIELAGNEICAFVDIDLFVKYGDEWSKPIPGTGGSKLLAIEKSGPNASDECFKMATTDAISVACKQLGFGADVYWDTTDSKYFKPAEPNNTNPATTQKPANNTSAQAPAGAVAKCADCGAEINAKVNDYSISKFGRPLCYNCQKKA